jgi:hypothetical protein
MEQDDEADMDAEVEEGGRVIWGEVSFRFRSANPKKMPLIIKPTCLVQKLEKLGVHRPAPEVEVGDLEVGPDWGWGVGKLASERGAAGSYKRKGEWGER